MGEKSKLTHYRRYRGFHDGLVIAYPQTVPPSTRSGRRVAGSSLDRGVRAGDRPGSAPCRGPGTPPLAIGRANAADPLPHPGPAAGVGAPLPRGSILAGLPRIPQQFGCHILTSSACRLATEGRVARRRWTGRLEASSAVGSWRGPEGTAVVGPWSGASRASVGAPTRSAEIRGWSEPHPADLPPPRRQAASGGAPRQRQGQRPRPPSGTSPQPGATSDHASGAHPEGTAAFVIAVRGTAMKGR
jgi:hypothetical protein